MTGRTLQSAVRRGKFLWFPLAESDDTVEALVVHLGMSGQVLLRDRQTDDALTRIRLDIAHPERGSLRLNFVDQRIFGSMAVDTLVATPDGYPGGFAGVGLLGAEPETGAGTAAAGTAVLPSQVAHIARDPLDPAFDDALFFRRLAARRTGIKRAILDQTLISGIGNIYADEALWAARIHFNQSSATLSRGRARLLLAEARGVLARALGEGGTSFDAQYVNVNWASGYFSHSLNAYGQHGKACPRCGRVLVRETFMNRGSHFCAFCQRLR